MKKTPMLLKIGLAGFISMLTVIWIFAGYAGYLAFVTQQWPVVSARVLQSEIVESQLTSEGRLGSRTSTRYTINITYAYTVEGRDYTSNRTGFFTTLNAQTQTQAEELRKSYLVGSGFVVHYNPNAPDQAVLLVGWQGVPWRLSEIAGYSAFVGAMACGASLLYPRKRRNRKGTRK